MWKSKNLFLSCHQVQGNDASGRQVFNQVAESALYWLVKKKKRKCKKKLRENFKMASKSSLVASLTNQGCGRSISVS